MKRLPIAACGSMVMLALLAPGAADAKPHLGKPVLAKVVTSAETAGAIATATPSCPKERHWATGRSQGPWRAVSGGFSMSVGQAVVVPGGFVVREPTGSGVVYESRKIGQRSWRTSAQSLWGMITLESYVNCQRRVPKTRSASSTVVTPGTPRVGPAAVATCRAGKTVAGGFSTPPPLTSTGAANTVVGSIPSGRKGWQAEVVSNRASRLTSYVYCAKRKRAARLLRSNPLDLSVATLANWEAHTYFMSSCPGKRVPADHPKVVPFGEFVPGVGGFSEQGLTPSQYLIPTFLRSSPVEWHANAIKVGSGTPVTLSAVTLCG